MPDFEDIATRYTDARYIDPGSERNHTMTTLEDIPFNIDHYLDRIKAEYDSLERAVLGYGYKKPTEGDKAVTPFDAAVTIAGTLLRVKNQWRGAGTFSSDIDRVVSSTCRVLGPVADGLAPDVYAELRKRADATK
jgi:hypothetical protein